MGLPSFKVGGKPKAEIVMRLLYATFRTYVPGELPSGRARHGVWLKAARASMATLEKLELKGYVHPEARALSPRPTLLRKTLAAVRLGTPVNDRPAEPQDDGIIDCSPFHPWRFAVDFHQSRVPVVTQTVVNVKSK